MTILVRFTNGNRIRAIPDSGPSSQTASRLHERCVAGIRAKADIDAEAVQSRVHDELQWMESSGLTAAILEMAELARCCREAGHSFRGRTECNASLVCYLVGVSAINPVQHDIPVSVLFSRKRCHEGSPRFHCEFSMLGESVIWDMLCDPPPAGKGSNLSMVKLDHRRALSVLDTSIRLANDSATTSLAADQFLIDDAATFQLIGSGLTEGIQALDSDRVRNALRVLKPRNLEDIAMVTALNRSERKYPPLLEQFVENNGTARATAATRGLFETLPTTIPFPISKAHAYYEALLAYQLAYVKAHFPDHFITAIDHCR